MDLFVHDQNHNQIYYQVAFHIQGICFGDLVHTII